MSILMRNRRVEENDFLALADDAAPPAAGKIIVGLARWQNENDAFHASGLTVGVRIPNTSDVDQIWASLKDLPLIAIEFPAFGDGRGYSQARILRDRYHFRGEIRALGAAVVRDQIYGMLRCGIDSFLLREDQDAQSCLDAYRDFSAAYQAAADAFIPVLIRRRT